MVRMLSILFVVTCMASCGSSFDPAAAEKQVLEFHRLYDDANYADIYQHAAPKFKSATNFQNFEALLQAVHRKLGVTKASSKQNWFVNAGTAGTFVTLKYKTSFSDGDGIETFVYQNEGDGVSLVGYHIDSSALVLK